VGAEVAVPGQSRGETSHPINDTVVRREGHGINSLDDKSEPAGERVQRTLVPPAQVVRGRIKYEVGDVRYRRRPARHGNKEVSAGFDAIYQVASEG
jgi:hypothetical protein